MHETQEALHIKTYDVSKYIQCLLAVLFLCDSAVAKTFDSNACIAAGGEVATTCPADRVLGDVTGVHCLCSCCKIIVPIHCESLAITIADACSTGTELRGVLKYDGKKIKATALYFELEAKKSRFMVNIELPPTTHPDIAFKGIYPKWAKGPPTKSSGYRLTFGATNQSCRLPGFDIPSCR